MSYLLYLHRWKCKVHFNTVIDYVFDILYFHTVSVHQVYVHICGWATKSDCGFDAYLVVAINEPGGFSERKWVIVVCWKNVIRGLFVLLVMSAGQQPRKIPAALKSSLFTAARQRKLEGLSAPHCWALSRCEAFGYNTFVSRASQLSLLLRNAKKRWNSHHNCTLGTWERERERGGKKDEANFQLETLFI